MSDQNPPTPSSDDLPDNAYVDKLRKQADEIIAQQTERAQQAYNDAPPEVKQAVEQSKSFYEANKKTIHMVLAGVVVMKVYKRKVAKASAKAVVKAIAKSDVIQPFANKTVATLPTMFEVLGDLNQTPGMVYIPHGGGMAHLSLAQDAVLTLFGTVEQMTNEQIFDKAARVLRYGW